MLTETKTPRTGMEPGETVTPHTFDTILPLSLIRDHTKTNDIPSVTDAQLALYRKAALSAAQRYTGLMLMEKRTVIEVLDAPPRSVHTRRSPTYWHKTKHPFATSQAFVYGYTSQNPRPITVEVGARRAKVPVMVEDFGLGCCNPCAQPVTGRIMYSAGFDCLSEAPVEIVLGALKYIAHVIENAGDIVVASNEAGGSSSGSVGVSASANPAIASGAVEIWRTVNPAAI